MLFLNINATLPARPGSSSLYLSLHITDRSQEKRTKKAQPLGGCLILQDAGSYPGSNPALEPNLVHRHSRISPDILNLRLKDLMTEFPAC